MKKLVFILVVAVICFSLALFVGCGETELRASFVRFSIGERTNDYYLDFTVKFENNTQQTQIVEGRDFYIEINGEEKSVGSFMYESPDVFLPQPVFIEMGETLTIRVRVIAQVNMGERNKILVKFHDTVLVDDNVYFNK